MKYCSIRYLIYVKTILLYAKVIFFCFLFLLISSFLLLVMNIAIGLHLFLSIFAAVKEQKNDKWCKIISVPLKSGPVKY